MDAMPKRGGGDRSLVVSSGPLAAEALLLRELRETLGAAERDWSLLARPVRVVVPSRSLREHVSLQLVSRLGGSLAGIQVQTHRALALELLERAGEPPPRGHELFPLLIRRLVRVEPSLCEPFEDFEDGFDVVAAAVEDFLDAGFESAHAQALEERLGTGRASEQARAVVRLAQRTLESLARLGLAERAGLLHRARERLESGGVELLPTRGLWIYGFADVTGVTLDWIQTLLARLGARVIVSRPPDPAEPSRPEEAFTRPLVERLSPHVERLEAFPAVEPPDTSLELLSAAGASTEVRAVAERIRALLDGGARPERIALLARSFAPYRSALPVQLERLGIPFSAPGLRAVSDAAGRRIRALLELLRCRQNTVVERWLDASAHPGAADPDLRLGLRRLGAARLLDVPAIGLRRGSDAGRLELPAVEGIAAPSVQGDDAKRAAPRVQRRRLARAPLERARTWAQRLLQQLNGWPLHASLQAHLSHLRALVGHELGWTPESGLERAFAQLEELEEQLPRELELERDEFASLMRDALEEAALSPLGGGGAGVQVLSVMEFRGRTCEHLFVLGLNRGVFPRPVSEDPLVSDEQRQRLRQLLPELPVKRRGRDEERHLFAELLASSPRVTLCRQGLNDEGRECPASPLVVRLREAHPGLAECKVSALGACEDDAVAPVPRPAREHALRAALEGGRKAFTEVLPAALEELRHELERPTSPGTAELSASRLAVLEELDPLAPFRGARTPLGPYFGFVGPSAPDSEAGQPECAITLLEKIAACPWQGFLSRKLHLEPVPDPLLELPGLEPRLLGTLVHRVLERIVKRRIVDAPSELPAALARGPTRVPWPDEASLQALLLAEAEQQCRKEGKPFPRLARALAAQARGALEVARQLDAAESEAGPAVFAAEVRGEVSLGDVDGRVRRIHFRADRLDEVEGRLRLTDYKTGRPISELVKQDSRTRKHFDSLRAGRSLQASAYLEALRGLASGPPSRARYLFLGTELPGEAREFAVPAEEAWREAFFSVCRTLLAACDRGVFFPRLVEPDGGKEPAGCESCEVRLACLRGESTQRARLSSWVEQQRSSATREEQARRPAQQALLRVWALADRRAWADPELAAADGRASEPEAGP
jgi:hypothetical protein